MAPDREKVPSNVQESIKDPQRDELDFLSTDPASQDRPVIVGIYGLPGSGKSFLLNQLKQKFGQKPFAFYEGSEMIERVVPGGLKQFQKTHDLAKYNSRRQAIATIEQHCKDYGKVGVVTGHFMFWPEELRPGELAWTEKDAEIFTHILYLDVPAEEIVQRCQLDTGRGRRAFSSNHIYKWQQEEQIQLRHICRQHDILFALVSSTSTLLDKVSLLLQNFRIHTESYNLFQAESELDELIEAQKQLKTVLVIDADKTLAAEDSGEIFWKKVSTSQISNNGEHTLKDLFSSPLRYSYTAFRQCTLLYEETANEQQFDALCQDVAMEINMHPEFISLLQLISENEHVGALIVTCGLRRVWEKVLKREGLSPAMKVIGGGRIADGYIVTAEVKGSLTSRLQDSYFLDTWAFGDSPLDLDMLHKAYKAVVVVGEHQTRSKSMDKELAKAVDKDGLQACQTMLPSTAKPRLDSIKLPEIKLTDQGFINSVFDRQSQKPSLHVLDATERNSAKLLMTPMRNANFEGSALREAHRLVGRYLATEFVADVIGLEEYPIRHVQGHQTTGYRLLHEQKTTIVALMRGGEPMAYGVNDVFPLAKFVHASGPEDLKPHHLQGQLTVVLVDSVVNSGNTVVSFEEHIRSQHATIRIVVVAGVVQAQAVSEGSRLCAVKRYAKLGIVALRLSDNKFTGRGTTDTGNRLFNTTDLP